MVGVLDYCFDVGCEYVQCFGIVVDCVYGDWMEMLVGEKICDDRIDLVIVVMLNVMYFEIIKFFFEVGFNVFCEKLMIMIVEEGEEIVKVVEKLGKICVVNYCYLVYFMVCQVCVMVCVGEIGKVCFVVINFSYGYYGDVIDVDNFCVCWCYDLVMVGVFGQFVDCGIYVLYMVSFISDDEVEMFFVDFVLIILS